MRIGRSLNQYVFTREKQVQNIVSTESYGAGIRVLAERLLGLRLHEHRDRGQPGRHRPPGRRNCQGRRQGAERARAARPHSQATAR
ncbi:MAG: hypothetical protein WKG07_38690 [Hymenobacter sp.]